MRYFVYFILTTLIVTLEINKNMSTPSQINVNLPQQNYQIYQNQYFSQELKFVNYQISANLYESKSSSSNILDSYTRNPDKFQISQTCKIQRSRINADKIFTYQQFDDRIFSSYRSGKNDSYIYAISGPKLYLLEIKKLSILGIAYVDQFDLNTDFFYEHSRFTLFNSNLYVSDGFQTYLIQLIQKDNITKLNVTNVAGYASINKEESLIKLLPLNQTYLLIITTGQGRLYTMQDKITWKKNVFSLAIGPLSTHTFVDALIADGKIYFLQKLTGFYIFNGLDDKTPVFYNFSYGQNIQFAIIANTIEIIFQYNKYIYIAQLIKTKDGISLNRFYDQISGFRDIQFFDNKAIFLGEDSVMVIGHSINRNLLLNIDKPQNKEIYGIFGMESIQIAPQFSQNNNLIFLGVDAFSLMLFSVNQSFPIINCNFVGADIGTKSFLLQFNASNCGSFSYNQWQKYTVNYTDSYCTIKQGLSIQIKRPFERKASLLFSISVILIIIVGILLIIGYAAKWKNQMNLMMQKIRKQIQKRKALASSQHGMKAI